VHARATGDDVSWRQRGQLIGLPLRNEPRELVAADLVGAVASDEPPEIEATVEAVAIAEPSIGEDRLRRELPEQA